MFSAALVYMLLLSVWSIKEELLMQFDDWDGDPDHRLDLFVHILTSHM